MSRDHETSVSPEEARALGRWLDQPGDAPPEDLDPEVVEAVYALRPDLAPAPQLTADDILAAVTRGPLGPDPDASEPSAQGEGADIVPFPNAEESVEAAEADPDAVVPPAGTGTAVRWAGGIGGAGLALVAAATLLLTVSPSSEQVALEMAPASQAVVQKKELERQVAEAPQASAADDLFERDEAEAPQERKRSDRRKEKAVSLDVAGGPAAQPEANEVVAPVVPSAASSGDEDLSARSDDAVGYAIANRTALEGGSVIPEAEPEARSYTSGEDAEAEELLDEVAERSVPREKVAAWRAGAPPESLRAADRALGRAEALAAEGRAAEAAAVLVAAMRGPGPVAHQLALRAAELLIDAGDSAGARAALAKATKFGEPSSDQRRRRRKLERRAAE